MKDATLSIPATYLPAAGATTNTPYLDLHVDADKFSDTWRLGRIRATVPAMPNHTDATKTITLTMQIAGVNTQPVIQVAIPGVASTGSVAQVIDIPLPPSLNGPVRFAQMVPAGDGNNTGVAISYDWVNE